MVKITTIVVLVGFLSVFLELFAILTMVGIVYDAWQLPMIFLIVGIAVFTLGITTALVKLDQEKTLLAKLVLDKMPVRKSNRKKKSLKKISRRKIPLKKVVLDE
jgi:hypothetical protein